MHIRHPMQASADEVWKQLTDFGSMAHWSPDLAMSTQIARHGVAVGAVRELTLVKPIAGIHTLRERIIQCGDMWYSYVLDGGFGPYQRAGSTWRVIPGDSGGSIVEVTSYVEDGPFWAMALRPITYVQLRAGIKRALETLDERIATIF